MPGLTRVGCSLLALILPTLAWGQTPMERPKPLPADVRAAWVKAGASVLWMERGHTGFLSRVGTGEGKFGEVPTFLLSVKSWEAAAGHLPKPEQPFGLVLQDQKPSDDALRELTRFKHLQSLSLSVFELTDGGLKEIAKLQSLRALDLSATKVTDAGMKEVAKLKQLQALYLDSVKITDVGMKEIGKLKELHTLDLRRTQISDAGLKELLGHPQLMSLCLFGTNISADARTDLRRALPGLYIR